MRKNHHSPIPTKKILVVWMLLLSVLACTDAEESDAIKPKITDITESVYASVKVRPEQMYFPQPSRSGIIKSISVKEGDMVEKGQVLFQMEVTADVENKISNTDINLSEAEANYLGNNNLLNNILLEIETIKQRLTLDSTNFERQKRLWAKDIGSKLAYDQAKLAYDSSNKQLAMANKKYAQTKTNLENNYKKALNQSKAERKLLKDFTVRAAMAGKIYSVYKEVGDYISFQEKFGEIGSAKSYLLEMDIDEVDIAKIAISDSILILLDAYPDDVFVATTTKIYPKKEELTQTFRVEGTFAKMPPKLYNGLAGEANIVVDKRKNALVIPANYLLTGNKVKTPEGIIPIETGLKNLEFVEVTAGIDTSTNLIKPNN